MKMIVVDNIEYRTECQWERKHRHVKKGQLGKGVERTWRSPDGNTTAIFYSEEQTRPWAKKDVEAASRKRRAAAKAKRDAEERKRIEAAAANDQMMRDLEACLGIDLDATGLTLGDFVDAHTAYQWVARGFVPIADARWRARTYGFADGKTWYYCGAWDVRYAPKRAEKLLESGPREYDRLPDGCPYDGHPWW